MDAVPTMLERVTRGRGKCDAQCATSEPSLLLLYKVNSIMWPQQIIIELANVIYTRGDAPASSEFGLCHMQF